VSLVCVQQSPRFSFSFFFFPGEILIGLNFKKKGKEKKIDRKVSEIKGQFDQFFFVLESEE
jgi:hypothetical protein